MNEQMDIRVLLFAAWAQRAGRRELMVRLPAGATAGDALSAARAMCAGVQEAGGRVALAVNERYAPASHVLKVGDVVAIIPPVSGG